MNARAETVDLCRDGIDNPNTMGATDLIFQNEIPFNKKYSFPFIYKADTILRNIVFFKIIQKKKKCFLFVKLRPEISRHPRKLLKYSWGALMMPSSKL